MTDNNSKASSMRTGENTCLYPNTTSMAVSTSSAAQTQKYCALLSSCFATSCIVDALDPLCTSVPSVVRAVRYETLVDIKYTSGKMNIHTRSTKCQYSPQTSTSCAS